MSGPWLNSSSVWGTFSDSEVELKSVCVRIGVRPTTVSPLEKVAVLTLKNRQLLVCVL